MSRLIVKNLPKNVSEAQLRSHFGKYGGEITDCTLKYTAAGAFRRFAFLGFVSEDQATAALKKFHGTRFHTQKIQVEAAKDLKQEDKERPWSKYSRGSSAYASLHREEIAQEKEQEKKAKAAEKKKKKKGLVEDILGELKDDEEFKEFLALRKGKSSVLADVDDSLRIGVVKGEEEEQGKKGKSDKKGKKKKKKTKEDSDSEESESEDEKETEEEEEEEEEETKEEKADEKEEAVGLEKHGRLFIRNLPYIAQEEDIESIFATYGPLSEVHFPICKHSKKPMGYAFVTFTDPQHAVTALDALDGTSFKGRMLHVIPGKPKKDAETEKVSDDATFKEKKAAAQRAKAGSSHNWNTLFLGANAVADVMASRLEQKKGDILDARGSESLGVRMALGETQLVAETRDFLLQNGVKLDEFSKPAAERSKTVILAKDLPADTTAKQLEEKFAKYGQVLRVVLPPSGVAALIEYDDATDAKKGFRKLAYSFFYDRPLYLEWAPMGGLTAVEKKKKREDALIEASTAAADNDDKGQSKILVRNIPFQASAKEIRDLFKVFGELRFVRLPKKVSGTGNHRGFGFVDFITQHDAKKAFGALCHSTHLYGRRLVLEWAKEDETIEELREKTAEAFGEEGPRRKKLKRTEITGALENSSVKS